MKAETIFKFLFYLVAGVMVFLFAKLHRQFVESNTACLLVAPTTPSAADTTATATATATDAAVSTTTSTTSTEPCPTKPKKKILKKVAKKSTKSQLSSSSSSSSSSSFSSSFSTPGVPDLAIDVLRYVQGEQDQKRRKQLKRSKQSKNAKEEHFRIYGEEAVVQPRVLDEVFAMYHHPSSPMTSEILVRPYPPANRTRLRMIDTEPYDTCQQVYLSRTGSLANMPNKCLILSMIPEQYINMRFPRHTGGKPGDEVSLFIPHYRRLGKISGLINMYQQDYVDGGAMRSEAVLVPSILEYMSELTEKIISLMGNPIVDESSNKRRSVIVMVLNEGVMDVFVNFLCSLKASNIYEEVVPHIIGFVGQESMVEVVEALGVKAFYSIHLGPIPSKAANMYGDMTFARMMWLKATSVYLASHAGYHVLFQDVDLVWMENPLPILEEMDDQDVIFMDDGARTPRFTPFYFNSGFYYVRHTPPSLYMMHRMLNSIGEISVTHSHQSVLTHYVHER